MAIGNDIVTASHFLNSGELVGIPTETVYGLAGNALRADVVIKIFEVKKRPTFDPLIVHCASIEAIKKYVTDVPDWASNLLKQFAPGPITVLLPRNSTIPDLVTSGLDRVAIRIPSHPVALRLLQQLEFPLAAPSANPFGYISPTDAAHVEAQLGNQIPYILDGGSCSIGVESTIIGEENGKLIIYRAGGLALEEIEKYTGKLEVRMGSSSPEAPGMLKSHYSPRKKLLLGNIEELIQDNLSKKISILSFQKSYPNFPNKILSPSGNVNEAAQHLFAYMRELDSNDTDIILAEKVPPHHLGIAINDRLSRAAE